MSEKWIYNALNLSIGFIIFQSKLILYEILLGPFIVFHHCQSILFYFSVVNYKEWKRVHMNDFVKMTMGFVEELEQPESKSRVITYESFFQQDGEK